MANFRPRTDDELNRLDDEALLAYIAAARARGEAEHAQRGLAILVFRYHDNMVRRCRIKLRERDDAEDVAQEAVVSAIRSSLAGRTLGEFRAWLNTIVDRRIADYIRRATSRPRTTPLPEEHPDSEEIWGQAGIVPDDKGVVEVSNAVDRVLGELSEAHRRVVERFVFDDETAEETVERVNAELPDLNPSMSIDNVSQIARRFRLRLRELLEENPG